MNILKRNFPHQISQLQVLRKMAAYYFTPRGEVRWLDQWPEAAPPPINDLPTAFASSVLFQRGYLTIIEIGTGAGERVKALKQMFPKRNFVGLDIQPQFASSFRAGEVEFAQYDLKLIAVPNESPSALLSFGVMCCMSPNQLHDFLVAAKNGEHDIIFREITPTFRHEGSIKRDTRTWYHNYAPIFKEYGYSLLGVRDRGQASQLDINSLDLGYFDVATLNL